MRGFRSPSVTVFLLATFLSLQVQTSASAAKQQAEQQEEKAVKLVLGQLPVPVTNPNGVRRAPMLILVLLTLSSRWTSRACAIAPRLIDSAVNYFDVHPLNQTWQGKTSLMSKPALLEAMNVAYERSVGEAAIAEIGLQERLVASSIKMQGKALSAGYVCANGVADKL